MMQNAERTNSIGMLNSENQTGVRCLDLSGDRVYACLAFLKCV